MRSVYDYVDSLVGIMNALDLAQFALIRGTLDEYSQVPSDVIILDTETNEWTSFNRMIQDE